MTQWFTIVGGPIPALIGTEARVVGEEVPSWESANLEVAVSPKGTNSIVTIRKEFLEPKTIDEGRLVCGCRMPAVNKGHRGWRAGRAAGRNRKKR